jgi:NhaA family Na+:H+ antiporter
VIQRAALQSVAPLQRIERAVHPFATFVVLPAFALANAGIPLAGAGLGSPVALGIVLGLVAGKLAGVLAGAWLAVRTGVADLPAGVGWRHVTGAGALAGIGFTMSLFVANLAFDTPVESAQARSAIFVASIVAGLLGYAALRFWAPAAPPVARPA